MTSIGRVGIEIGDTLAIVLKKVDQAMYHIRLRGQDNISAIINSFLIDFVG